MLYTILMKLLFIIVLALCEYEVNASVQFSP
jgi:hypothetical protein